MNLRPILAVLLALGAAAGVAAFVGQQDPAAPPPLPADPFASQVELVSARPFELDAPAVHDWRAERPAFTGGWVVVLRVDPALVVPRQTFEPVLYAGAQTVQRLNQAQGSGHLVGILPAPAGATLAEHPFFFGEPALPEQVDAAHAAAELARARAAGLAEPSGAALDARTEPSARFRDEHELRLYAADLIERWAPDERELVEGLRAPLVR